MGLATRKGGGRYVWRESKRGDSIRSEKLRGYQSQLVKKPSYKKETGGD